ncbi:MAG: hypothetical protein CMI67_23030 [Pelagibaca sp.]|nr:hypothetical protein [Pelagibaca sp.]|tara:strand:+ start:420 stop:854 length:435 start_codon:yes stop_codon:yes gene_type:complete
MLSVWKRCSALGLATWLGLLGAAPASAWQHDFERGVDLYRVASGGAVLFLVCDPNKVYGNQSESALMVQLGADDDFSGPVRIAFPDETVIDVQAERGRVAKRVVATETWGALLDGLRGHDTLELTMKGSSRRIETGEGQNFTCN